MKRIALALALVGSCVACRTADAQSDSLNARLRVAQRAYDSGKREEAYKIFDSFIEVYNSGARLRSDELTAVGIAVQYLGAREPVLFKDALRALDEAVAADSTNVAAHIAIGRLFLSKYNAPEALQAFAGALRVQPGNADALLGRAEALEFNGDAGALDAARAALKTSPNHIGAHAFLARVFLDTDELDSARVHVTAAQRIDAESADAIVAAAMLAQREGNRAALAALQTRVNGNSTLTAELNLALAELSVRQRQYKQAVEQASAAIAANGNAWQAWSVLGINQLRVGDVANARKTLETAFKGDPYNVWVKNSLDLLDRLDGFVTRSTPRFTVVAAARDANVLGPYVDALGEEAYAKLKERYGYEPPLPVRLEIFDRHADFSVRTVGLAGLGALGVSFGSVLAMDAPSARDPKDFVWGSTFWHELAHAFHLGMTGQRVPRWFTEGLAVLEERRARPGWGEEGLPLFVRAAQRGQLLPLGQLNAGFTRPTYPQQVAVSYYQASLVLEMIEQQHGPTAMRDLLRAYASGKTNDAALQSVLHQSTEQVDAAFRTFLEQWLRDAPRRQQAADAASYDALVANGSAESLERAIFTFPYDPRIHQKLADAYAAAGAWPKVVRERQVIVALQPVDIAEARYQLALAYHNAGDQTSARKAVLRALEEAPNFARAQELLIKLQNGARNQ